MMSRSRQYAAALLDALEATPPTKRGECLDRFVALLKADQALPLGPAILSALEVELHERERRATTTAVFARPLQAAMLKRLDSLAPVVATADPSLVGGVVVRQPSRLVDGSVRGLLATMRSALVARI